MWLTVITGILAVITALFFMQNNLMAQEMTVQELQKRMERDSSLVLVDVRTVAEMQGPMVKLQNAIALPMQELSQRMEELHKHKDKEIAVICRSGNRSGTVTRLLRQEGYKAFNVTGGMIAYTRAFPDTLR